MNVNRRGFGRTIAAAVATTCPYARALASEAWPSKPITCVVGYAPGGGVDFVMRTIAPHLGSRLGQAVVVDNKPGAGGILAARQVAQAPADGYTLLGTDGGALVLNSALYAKLPYDPIKDFAPISQVIRVPLLIVANPSFPASDLRTLIELSKRQSIDYASAGKGTYHQLAMELLKHRTGLRAQDVPYKGASPAALEVISGQVPIAPLDTIVALPHIRAGKLKALTTLTPLRLPSLPDVPTAEEQGIADVQAYAWVGIAAPGTTRSDLVERLSNEVREIVRLPEVDKRVRDLGMEPHTNTPRQFAEFIEGERKRWHPVIRSLGLRLD